MYHAPKEKIRQTRVYLEARITDKYFRGSIKEEQTNALLSV
jgi:hypothetical protein